MSKESVDLAVRNTNSPRFSPEVCITSLNSHLPSKRFKTRYGSWFSKEKVWIKVCNTHSQILKGV